MLQLLQNKTAFDYLYDYMLIYVPVVLCLLHFSVRKAAESRRVPEKNYPLHSEIVLIDWQGYTGKASSTGESVYYHLVYFTGLQGLTFFSRWDDLLP